MKILEELYYGEISPFEKGNSQNKEYQELLYQVMKSEEKLGKGEKELYKKCKADEFKLTDCDLLKTFCKGFRPGVKIIIHSMTE